MKLGKIHIFAIVFSIVVTLAYIAFVFVPNNKVSTVTRSIQAELEGDPATYVTPVPRIVETAILKSYKATSLHGVTFQVPFNPTIVKDQGTTAISYADQPTGKMLLFSKGVNIKDILMEQETVGSVGGLGAWAQHFGVSDTNYSLYTYILELKLDTINTSGLSVKEKAVQTIMLLMKATFFSDEYIFSFTVSEIKGYQFGMPEKSERVSIEFFDTNDTQYTFLTKNLTQQEIDFILSSIVIED